MPNIVNPAVAVAAQGGGKFLHCISMNSRQTFVDAVLQYVSDKAEPYTAQTFRQELISKGFNKATALYPVGGGAITPDSSSSTDTFYSSVAYGIYADRYSNSFYVEGYYYMNGDNRSGSKEISIENESNYNFTDIVL